MGISSTRLENAVSVQKTAAQDKSSKIRLVAGPGTGKSYVIEDRVYWLITERRVPPEEIFAISFTRAAANDLRLRIYDNCLKKGVNTVERVRVSTLHSLALKLLRASGDLKYFPAEPAIMDEWELENIFEAEFSVEYNVTPTRCKEIRLFHESFWSTGKWGSPNLSYIKKPLSQTERNNFHAFYYQRANLYCCVLPGEVVRTCVDKIKAGSIDPVQLLGMSHLIIDEVQDLNFCDFEFIDHLIKGGVSIFISGDDDQSIYSFRYAFPQGIQDFPINYPDATNHILNDCFRCAPIILNTALNLLNTFPDSKRIAKNLTSVYNDSEPPVAGVLKTNKFQSVQTEARYIASSCKELIAAGLDASEIMILISYQKAQSGPILEALAGLGVEYDVKSEDDFKDSESGRFLQSILRIISNNDDYLAYRTLLGTPSGIGTTTANNIANNAVKNQINYKDLFYKEMPEWVFNNRESNTLSKAKTNLNHFIDWTTDDLLKDRLESIVGLVNSNFNTYNAQICINFLKYLPENITLAEIRSYLSANSESARQDVINKVNIRLGIDQQKAEELSKVKVTTLYSSKGLNAKVVFIPGLEEGILPSEKSAKSTGAIQESARLLYVGITRAKAACILSYCSARFMQGKRHTMVPSRFCVSMGQPFVLEGGAGLNSEDIQEILTTISQM